MIPYSSSDVASYFLKKGVDENIEITPMKIIKLVYIANGWYMALSNESAEGELNVLIDEESQAWPYGPVIPSIYNDFKIFGKLNLTEVSWGMKTDHLDFDDETANFLDVIWEKYKHFTGIDLSNLTHQKNTPWDLTYIEGEKNKVIPKSTIFSHYKNKLEGGK